jgi:phenylalanyl-tRNA synthetase beta chain
MKFLLSWLKQFLELSLHPEALAERLTMAGCEVTSLDRVDGDWLFEVEVTPNRPDWLSHLGLAREAAAVLGHRFRLPRWLQREIVLPGESGQRSHAMAIALEDSKECRRYVGILIEGVQVASSPPAAAQRLTRLGIRPVNNVVDATNLCLLELGQPLHAFDAGRLQGSQIRVRRAGPKESLVTIDGEARPLTPELLVIADAKRPVALAGVMGGRDTEITPETRNVFLESAWFDPTRIRLATRATRLSSESSHRFEREVDPAMVPLAAIRAARLICQLAGGRIAGEILDQGERQIPQRSIPLRTRRLREILGIPISPPQQRRLLERIGCHVSGASQGFRVKAPSWRADLKIPEDLVEEIARLWGYERTPSTLPPIARQRIGSQAEARQDPRIAREERIREILAGAGLQEIMTYSLLDPKDQARARVPDGDLFELENPLSLEYSALRKTLLVGALQAVARNLNRKAAESFALFELGHLYRKEGTGSRSGPRQPKGLSLLLAGTPAPTWTDHPPHPLGLFHLKGIIQLLCERLSIGPVSESVEPESAGSY